MKIRVLSDLHLEFKDWVPPEVPADVVVLAGDISSNVDGIVWARQHFKDVPVIYVPGNHEFYGLKMDQTLDLMRSAARRVDVTLLDGDETVIEGVRFLGATLWTDFRICDGYNLRPADGLTNETQARIYAQRNMTDFGGRYAIRFGHRHFKPSDSATIHFQMRKWLEERLAVDFAGPTVVITHHLPSPRSIHPKYRGDILNAAFASDLTALFGPRAPLWIHGHTHESFDYVENGTRVVCNPRGYLPQEPNPAFDPNLVVEI